MATSLEDLRVLQAAETMADGIWRRVVRWDPFARDVVGGQLARAVDSIGANIAEAFGRFHYGEKLQFLYYARGSLYETKYWLNRALARGLLPSDQVEEDVAQLTSLARQLNAFAGSLKAQRQSSPDQKSRIQEERLKYIPDFARREEFFPLFAEEELEWLETLVETGDWGLEIRD